MGKQAPVRQLCAMRTATPAGVACLTTTGVADPSDKVQQVRAPYLCAAVILGCFSMAQRCPPLLDGSTLRELLGGYFPPTMRRGSRLRGFSLLLRHCHEF